MQKIFREFRHFFSYPRDMRVLLITNLIYGLVMPVIEMFIGAYVMRKSDDVKMVVVYQLAVYTGIPFTFLINGWLLQLVNVKRLYSLGMLLSGVSMVVMMSLNELSLLGLGVAGVLMGMSFGLYWANRDYLALSSTIDENRNYYYGLETFFATNIGIVVPFLVGAFIGWYGGEITSQVEHAYQIITGAVFAITIAASIIVHQGKFKNPPPSRFLYFRYHWIWNRIQWLAILKGLAQGYIVTAPAMLIMTHVGKEGSLGTILSAGSVLAAILLYILGRTTGPRHRIYLFAIGLSLFALGALANALLFNKLGVLLFMLLLVLARPLADIAYFTIQLLAIDTVSAIEKRNQYTYIFVQEFGFYIGRFAGCGLFILLATQVSSTFALRYALLIVAALQLLSVFVAKIILKGCAKESSVISSSKATPRIVNPVVASSGFLT
ncbi:MAG TPA: MFS transporter [Verrucomicrobiae bacterium]|jgi:YQGE family putative transporter|nr:MFS transporter [Verrucomicrobiae bacterium]